jgi:hypothetical protein
VSFFINDTFSSFPVFQWQEERMYTIKSKPASVLLLFLILCFAAVHIHADTGERSLFVVNRCFFDSSCLPGLNGPPVAELSRPMNGKPLVSAGKFVLEVLSGIAGNIIGTGAGIGLGMGLNIFFPAGHEVIIPPGVLLGAPAGSLFGSALGVCLAGNSKNAKGSFGSVVLGSFLGELAAVAIATFVGLGDREGGAVATLSFAILPPVGAAIAFNSSLRARSIPAGNALLNLSGGRIGLGIPDIHVRPLPAYGENMKAEIQFKINLLSIVL